MKIVVLEGSPHKKGSSNMLAEQFVKGAKETGHNVEILHVAHMDMHPCIGCDHCGMNGECVHRDDNRIIRDALLGSDMVVFVTPMSAKHLKAALITAAWDSNDDVMPYTAEHYKKLCRYMNFENCGMVLGTGCGSPSMTRGSRHMDTAYRLGKSL